MIHLSLLCVCVNSRGQQRDVERLPNSTMQKVITSCNSIAIDFASPPNDQTEVTVSDRAPVIDRSRANPLARALAVSLSLSLSLSLLLLLVDVTGFRGSFRNTNRP